MQVRRSSRVCLLGVLLAFALLAAACGGVSGSDGDPAGSSDGDSGDQEVAANQDEDTSNLGTIPDNEMAVREPGQGVPPGQDVTDEDDHDEADDSDGTGEGVEHDEEDEAHEHDGCEIEGRPISGITTLESGGNTYQYSYFVPSGYTGDPTPLVLNFHGLGGNGTGQSGYTRYSDLAEEENFVVVHPTGQIDPNTGLNSWELPQYDTDRRDDVAFTRDLIAAMKEVTCVDENRIYATGMSNGGFFSAVLACELSDVIAATFSVAGLSHPDGCSPTNPIAMGAIHGTNDVVVSYQGEGSTLLTTLSSISPELRSTAEEFFAQIIPDEMAEFAADMGCDQITDTAHSADTTLRSFLDCDDPNVEVRFYTVDGGEHVWPGAGSAVGKTTADFDATRDGWAFLSQFTLDGRAG